MKPSIQKVQNPEQVRADMRKMRELLRMNQEEFAELIGLPRPTLNAYEKGSQEWGQERFDHAYLKVEEYIDSYRVKLFFADNEISQHTTLYTSLIA